MAFLSSMNISASGMTAQRLRLDTISENIANRNTTRTEAGGAYRRKMVVFEPINGSGSFRSYLSKATGKGAAAQGGVRVSAIIEDESELKAVYDPTHPDANEDGYVMMPNVELLKETVDTMEATQAYSANIQAFNALKLTAQKALEIGK